MSLLSSIFGTSTKQKAADLKKQQEADATALKMAQIQKDKELILAYQGIEPGVASHVADTKVSIAKADDSAVVRIAKVNALGSIGTTLAGMFSMGGSGSIISNKNGSEESGGIGSLLSGIFGSGSGTGTTVAVTDDSSKYLLIGGGVLLLILLIK
jgi:hypothetical protein